MCCLNAAAQSERLPGAFAHGKKLVNAMLSIVSIAILAVIVAASLGLDVQARSADDARALKFISEYEARVRPLEKAVNLAWWTANVSGKDEDFKTKEQAQNKLDEALADRERFAEIT